jgi:hypothetical protein
LVRFCNEARPFISDRVQHANSFGNAIKAEFRDISSISPELPTLPDMRRSISDRARAVTKDFDVMTKNKLVDKEADFHEFMSFLGRLLKPVK